ncbi:MAG: response regulator [Limisphaerales bacterium]
MSVVLSPILAADDEETDRLILRLAFEKAGLSNPLVIVRDGVEAVDYLAERPPYANRAVHPLPALLLLDWKMPIMDGLDVLGWLAARPEFKHLPAIILSSSSADDDIQKARQMGARDFLVKPHDLNSYMEIFQNLRARWLSPAQAA